MIVTRDVFSFNSTSVLVGATTQSIASAYVTRAGAAVDAGLDLLRYRTKTFFVANKGPLAPLVGEIQATNIPAEQRQSNDWEVVDNAAFAAVLAGTAKSRVFDNDSRRYWRLRMSSTAPAVAVASITAR